MQRELLERCIQAMNDNVESDCEDGGATYSLLWVGTEPSIVCFRRTTYYDTGEDIGYGAIDMKSHTRDLFEVPCTLIEYTNLAINVLGHMEEYKYEYGNDIGRIKFMPVYNPK